MTGVFHLFRTIIVVTDSRYDTLCASGLEASSPAEIDAVLFDFWATRFSLASRRASYLEYITSAQAGKTGFSSYSVASYQTDVDALTAELTALAIKIDVLETEFDRRGGWTRYFLVMNTGGHLHRDRACSTCFPTTQFCLVAEGSGLDDDALIERFAEQVCSVCFPDAPSRPSYARGLALSKAQRATAKAAKEAVKAEKAAVKAAKMLREPVRLSGRFGDTISTIYSAKLALKSCYEQLSWYPEMTPDRSGALHADIMLLTAALSARDVDVDALVAKWQRSLSS